MEGRYTNGRAGPDAAAGSGDALWYKDAVVYQTHVKAYCDSDDDGIGDLRGLTGRLDYIRDLGVDAVWLLPFYPSPLKDDGYDIADYGGVHPHYGTLEDFRRFLDAAHARGLRVITELVINHTSDQHAWFQAARRAPRGSPERDFYVWTDDPALYRDARIIFTDTEKSNWTWDEAAGQYYWHRFFSHQPDLNFDNPRVVDAVVEVMRRWLDMGVDGLRLDAIPYLIERDGTNCENLPETHAILKRLRAELDVRHADRLFLAEANQWPEDVRAYFGDGDECHMAYHFPLMPRMYMAIAQEDRHPIVDIMNQTPAIPDACQWAIFLRNHDELTLEMVTSRERDYMYGQYAADPRARINLGIRRRLAPLMENDPARIRLMNALLLSMPGTPIVYYGDELGMGDNIYLGDRNGVRTPMQWSPDRNGGFSRADPQRLYLPPIMDPIHGFQVVNVEAQLREPNSLLNWTKRMLAVRRQSKAFGRGTLAFVRPGNRKILAYVREHEGETILCVANLARTAQPVELDLRSYAGRVPVEMLGRTAFPPIGQLPYLLTLPGHQFYWFRLEANAQPPSWHVEMLAADELPVLVLFEGWDSLDAERVAPWRRSLAESVRRQLEQQVLPHHLGAQRWYGGKGEPLGPVRIVAALPWLQAPAEWLLAFVDVEHFGPGERPPSRWFLPLTLVWEDAGEVPPLLKGAALARARRHARVGLVSDAMLDERFVQAVLAGLANRETVRLAHGSLHFRPTGAFPALAGAEVFELPCRPLSAATSNTTVALGERLLFKCFRRLAVGVHPEVEIGEFLTDRIGFPHSVRLAGSLQYEAPDGTRTALGVVQEFVLNQGDGWRWATEYLERYLDRLTAGRDAAEEHGAFLSLIGTLADRTGALHAALARATDVPAFAPEPVGPGDLERWAARVGQDVHATLARVQAAVEQLPPALQPLSLALAAARDPLLRLAATPTGLAPDGLVKTRHHGDFHLGQVLLAKSDFLIVDFEGEPQRSMDERRAKHLALRDVAGMLRSFDYVRHAVLAAAAAPACTPSHRAAADGWLAQTQAAFLDAYLRSVAAAGLARDDARHRTLVDFLLLEQALHEVRYELDNRPDWIGAPLAALLQLARRGEG
ncbi:MAG: maltose alpha-D-glucosyltransferase [Steroidobacteraceae bacterium]|nr:maltose alpha-D-glucosyltransferase [Steroidobacteraceae bacterium]